MKGIKYLGMILCILLIIGTLPSVFLISKGLIAGPVDDVGYFLVKLCSYIAIILVLAFITIRLFKSASR